MLVQVFSTALGNALSGRPLAGALLWMLAAATYPDYDGYTCRLPGTEEPQQPCPCDDSAAVALVLRCAARMQGLNSGGQAAMASL